METLQLLGHGVLVAMQPMNLLFAGIGVLLGTLVGILPGISPSLTVALLLPITFKLDPTGSIIMFAGIYFGGMYGSSTFASFFASLPLLGIDGSLATVTEFESDASLAPAKGQVRAKTGTFIEDASIRGQAFAGYIQTRGGRKLAYQLVVNNVPFKEIEDVIQVFQDEGRISAILWRDN